MNGNRKGPEDKGPNTGRGFGYCNSNDQPGFINTTNRQGMRNGGCRGRGNGQGRGQADILSRIVKLENEVKEFKK